MGDWIDEGAEDKKRPKGCTSGVPASRLADELAEPRRRVTPSLRIVAASRSERARKFRWTPGRSDAAMKYSESFKTRMVQKMAGGRSASSLSQEVGVNQPTLSRW
jgi:hypothetical protein